MGGGDSGGGGFGTQTTVYQPAPIDQTVVQSPQIPPELKGLVTGGATQLQNIQNLAPLSQYLASRPQEIAPLTDLQNYGASLVPTLNQQPLNETLSQWASLTAPDIAARSLASQISADDPLVKAQQQAFEANSLPLIQNQAAKMGLGRSSSVLDAMARGEAATLPGAINTALSTELAQQQGQVAALAQGASNLAGLSTADTARTQGAINTAETVGAVQQTNQQQVLNAAYQDYLRRMGLSEEAVTAGMGVAPSTIGTASVSSGTQYINPTVYSNQSAHQSGGGMFK